MTYKKIPFAICKENLDFSGNKKILIAGSNSYIGESFKRYMTEFNNCTVDSFDTLSQEWENIDFSKYDVVYDVAGIVHIKETNENKQLYYDINRDLAIKIAQKAKNDGVKQFVYLSTMSVYGIVEGRIEKNTKENPINSYGKSKLEAEQLLWDMEDENFKILIVRPPMVYGNNCKGNYQSLRKFALKFNIFPNFYNERSMIYIDNLSSAVRGVIYNAESGLYCPQNIDYLSTADMVKKIAECNNKKNYSIKLFNFLIKIFIKRSRVLKKVFGSLTYEKSMNVPSEWLIIKNNDESIILTENGD